MIRLGRCILISGILLCLGSVFAQAAAGAEHVAIVASLSGEAFKKEKPQMKKDVLHLFDWLLAGTVVEVGPGASVTLAFRDGARYLVKEKSTVTIAANEVASVSGSVEHLSAVPPLPKVSAIVAGQERARSGAIRIRGERIKHLYPAGNYAVPADETVLQFDSVQGASKYKVEVEDEVGNTLFHVETESNRVNVSPGVLKPGADYYWKVQTVDKIGQAARGEGEFTTLSADNARLRQAFKDSAEKAGDAASMALLAEIDHSLGLLREAREEFTNALAKTSGDSALQRALDQVERQMKQIEPGQ